MGCHCLGAWQAWINIFDKTEEWWVVLVQLQHLSVHAELHFNKLYKVVPSTPASAVPECFKCSWLTTAHQAWEAPEQTCSWAACSCALHPCCTWEWAESTALQKAIATDGWSSTSAQATRACPWASRFPKTRPSSSSEASLGAAPLWCVSCWTPTTLCAAGRKLEWFPVSWPWGPPGANRPRSECDWTKQASLTMFWTQQYEHSCWRWVCCCRKPLSRLVCRRHSCVDVPVSSLYSPSK